MDDAGFVVGAHQRDQSGVGTETSAQFVQVDLALRVDGQIRHLPAVALQPSVRIENGAVLGPARDQVATARVGVPMGDALDGEVGGLGRPARPDQSARIAADQVRHVTARRFDRFGCGPAPRVRLTRRVTELIGEVGQHRRQHVWVDGRRGVVVEVDHESGKRRSASCSSDWYRSSARGVLSFASLTASAMRRLLAPLLLLFVFAACDSASDEPRIAGGVDLDVLFAPPTQAEKQTILNEWQARTPIATESEVVRIQDATIAGRAYTASTYRYVIDGLDLYGLVLVPTEAAAAGSLPVLLYGHGGDGGTSLAEVSGLAGILLAADKQAIWVAPSFRDEPLRLGDAGTLTSEGPASPWDRDVDDALALLDVALAANPSADAGRIGAVGLSRGGGVSLLLAVRDQRITRVLDFFGPTDFFGPFVQDIAADALEGGDRNLPGFDVLNARFIQPLQRGEISVADMRLELLRRSPAQFADRLPVVQAQHGTDDPTVLVGQTRLLERALREAGRQVTTDVSTPSSAEAEFFYWEGGVHNPASFPLNWIGEAQGFLGKL